MVNCGDHAALEDEEDFSIHLYHLRWSEIGGFVVFALFIVMSAVAKIAFHHVHFLSSRLPESCILILVGILWAVLLEYSDLSCSFPEFSPDLFFHYLLPPIILEAAYSLYHRAFFDNLPTILLYAVVGTSFNFLVLGGLLIGIDKMDMMGEMTREGPNISRLNSTGLQPVEIFTFSSIISAVDPVAVLAIFSEVGVNPDLYYMVFGESLLNDGVAVVLYNMMNSFAGIESTGEEVTITDCLLGVTSFFTIALGGLFIGVVTGLFTALITKFTKEVRVVESLVVLLTAYLAYMLAELVHWSGIISLIGCGIVQSHYSFKNISDQSRTTILYFVSMLSSTMDCLIFLYLGISTLDQLAHSASSNWYPGFIMWTLVLCLMVRFIGVYLLTFLANTRRVNRINLQEQFIMAYGGLRGGVGFSLVKMVQSSVVPRAEVMVNTVLVVVMATVWIQGATIKPLVGLLNIDKDETTQKKLLEQLTESFIGDVMTNMEIIVGVKGRFFFQNLLTSVDEKYMMPIFTRKDYHTNITRIYEDLMLEDHKLGLYKTDLDVLEDIEIGHDNPALQIDEKIKTPNGILKPSLLDIPEMRMRKDSVGSNVSALSRISRISAVSRMFSSGVSGGSGEVDQEKILKRALSMHNGGRTLVEREEGAREKKIAWQISQELVDNIKGNDNMSEDTGSIAGKWLQAVSNARKTSVSSVGLRLPASPRLRSISTTSQMSDIHEKTDH